MVFAFAFTATEAVGYVERRVEFLRQRALVEN